MGCAGYESTAPVAAIMGPREQRVSLGVTITLKCVITSPYQTKPIKGVQWFKDNKLLTFQVSGAEKAVKTWTGVEILWGFFLMGYEEE